MAYSGDGQVKGQYNCRDCRAFQRDIKYLEHLLGKERARSRQRREWRLTLCQALDEAHAKLSEMQPLEERPCDSDEETHEPEDWEEDSEALSITESLTETTERNQETDLHIHYKELKEAYIVNKQMFDSELQVERSKNEAFLDELEKLRASNNEIIQRYEAENLIARQQATHLKAQLEKTVESQMDAFQAEQGLTSQLSLKREREDVDKPADTTVLNNQQESLSDALPPQNLRRLRRQRYIWHICTCIILLKKINKLNKKMSSQYLFQFIILGMATCFSR